MTFHRSGETVYAAWHLWNVAADAAQRSRDVKKVHPKACTADTLSAVLLAAVASEAFINELSHRLVGLARPGLQNLNDWIVVGERLEKMEQDREQVKSKYLEASELLPGEPLQKGAPPYQDFSLLIDMRNSFAHARAQEAPPKYFEQFVSRGWTYNAKTDEVKLAGWMIQLETPQIACWACRSAHNIVWNLVERFDNAPEVVIQVVGDHLRFQWEKTLDDERVRFD